MVLRPFIAALVVLSLEALIFGASDARATTKSASSVFGSFCADLLSSPLPAEDRLFDAYMRTLANYRGLVSSSEFHASVTRALERGRFYDLPSDHASAPMADLLSKIGEAKRKNRFPGDAQIDPVAFDAKVKSHLEAVLSESRAAAEAVKRTIEKSRVATSLGEKLVGHKSWVGSFLYDPEFERAFSCSGDGSIIEWDLRTNSQVRKLSESSASITEIRVSPDRKTMVSTGGKNGGLSVWDLEKGMILRSTDHPEYSFIEFETNADFSRAYGVVRSKAARRISVLDLGTGKEIASLNTGLVVFSSDGKSALSYEGGLKIWDLENLKEKETIAPPSEGITNARVSTDFRKALTYSNSGEMAVWDLEKKLKIQSVHVTPNDVYQTFPIEVSSDFRYAFLWAYRSEAAIWDLKLGKRVSDLALADPKLNFSGTRFTPDSKYFIVGSAEGEVIIYRTSDGKLLHRLAAHRGRISKIEISADSKHVITAGSEGDVLRWDLDQIFSGTFDFF